ncbi:MAG TPA: hypothetical protein VGJ22_06515 [Anaerolineales bacterium]|jgi:hypothetical protein
MKFDFGDVLTRAWQITWKHKVLWIFGILAGCAQGRGNANFNQRGGGNGDGPTSPQAQRFFENIGQWISDHPWIVAAIVIALVLFTILLIFLGTVGRIGLIRGTAQAEAGVESLAFGTLFKESLVFFWPVLWLSVLIGLAFLVLIVPLVAFGFLTAGFGFLCIIPLLCVLVPLAWAATIVLEQANAAIVIENLGVTAGMRRGWQVVRSNVGPMIVMSLILFVLSFFVGVVLVIPVFIIVLPAMLAFGVGLGESTTPLLVAGLCFVAYLPVLIVLQGILTAYIGSAWTLTYMRLAAPIESSPTSLPANA